MNQRKYFAVCAALALLSLAACSPDNFREYLACVEGDTDLRIEVCTRIVQSGRETGARLALTLGSRGDAYNDLLNHDRAIQDYDRAIEVDASIATIFNNRGATYNHLGNYDRAIQDFDEAIRLDPNDGFALSNRALTYFNKQDYDRAIRDYDEVIRLDPSDAIAFYDRGNAHGSLGNYDRAIRDYDESIRLDPNYGFALNNRARAYFNKQDYDRALRDILEAIRIDPNGAEFLNNAAWLLATGPEEIRNGAQAIEFAQKAAELMPDEARFRDTLAAAHAEAGQFDSAVEEQRLAIQLLGDAPDGETLSGYENRLNLYEAEQPYRGELSAP